MNLLRGDGGSVVTTQVGTKDGDTYKVIGDFGDAIKEAVKKNQSLEIEEE